MADDSQIGDLRQIRQDLILNAIGKISVVFVVAQAIERQDGDRFLNTRRRCPGSRGVTTEEKQGQRDDGADDNNVNPGAFRRPGGPRHGIGIFGALEPFGCDLKCPRENERNRKTDDN